MFLKKIKINIYILIISVWYFSYDWSAMSYWMQCNDAPYVYICWSNRWVVWTMWLVCGQPWLDAVRLIDRWVKSIRSGEMWLSQLCECGLPWDWSLLYFRSLVNACPIGHTCHPSSPPATIYECYRKEMMAKICCWIFHDLTGSRSCGGRGEITTHG